MPALEPLSPTWQPRRVPEPPRYDLWPVALRSAWKLRGALVQCGPGVRGIGWPETPRVRLTALAEWLGEDRIASHLTAAWVWGAARRPHDPMQLSMKRGRRAPLQRASDGVRNYELRLAPADTVRFGVFEVTSPLRTVYDLLYDTERFARVERVACRLLFPLIKGGAHEVRQHLAAHRRPHRRLAQARLTVLCGEG